MLPKPAHLPARLFVHELHPILAAALLLLAGLALSYRLALLQHRNDIDRMRDQVTSELDKVRGDLSRELFASINLTQGLVSLVTIQGEISHQQFEAIAGELMSHAHNIRNIALAPDNVIRFIYPHQGNEEALGLDYLKTTEQRETVLRAISEKRMIVAGPVKLVQGGTGIIGRTPIYLRESSTNVGSTRYWGISATVIDFDTLIQDARLDRAAQLRFALRGKDGKGSSGEIFWGDAGIFRSDPVMMDVALAVGQLADRRHTGLGLARLQAVRHIPVPARPHDFGFPRPPDVPPYTNEPGPRAGGSGAAKSPSGITADKQSPAFVFAM
jgi:sensor domain CHASE-containing protein